MAKKSITLTSYLHDRRVVFLTSETRFEAMNALAQTLDEEGVVPDKRAFLAALEKRESIVSTGIGMGVAIPHAKLPGFSDFCVAIGIKRDGAGIEWDSLDGSPVRIVFLIGGPDAQQMEYLELLSAITKTIKNEPHRQALIEAESREDVIEILRKSPC